MFISTLLTRKFALLSIVAFSTFTQAAEISVSVFDSNGSPVKDAVVFLQADDGQIFTTQPNAEVIDQVNKQFAPRLKVITKNSQVSFPNNDDIHHHVYSFSEAKTFELPLYEGKKSNAVTFDKTGVVNLGCNIHDWMKATVVVVDTPFFDQSDESGRSRLGLIPAGSYKLKVWHSLADGSMDSQQVVLLAETKQSIKVNLKLKKQIKKRRAPRGRGRRY